MSEREKIYTIGYEGKKVEDFLDIIRSRGIKLLVDIRANAYSRKPGFTRGSLQEHCKRAGVDYRWIPELGIPSQLRREMTDRKELLCHYSNTILPSLKEGIEELENLLGKYKKLALTCLEADPLQCHRSILAEYLAERNDCEIEHL